MSKISHILKHDISCVILAGGRGTRMGGQDKGLVKFNNLPLIEHTIEKIRPQVGEILISANRNLKVYAQYGLRIVTDTTNEFQGPLAGILAAMCVTKTPLLATIPCDSPFLPDVLIKRLYQSLIAEEAELAVAYSNRIEPVSCLMKVNVLNSLQNFLHKGGRKIDQWHEEIKVARADFSDMLECFRNINSPEDMETFLKNQQIQ